MADHAGIDKHQARLAFSRAAPTYDEVALLQREIGQRMLARLHRIELQPEVVLDLGAGTGIAAAELGQIYKQARIIALDFAFPMLVLAQKRGGHSCLCADLEQLPVADKTVDMIYSNAAIQWSNDLGRTFQEFLRVLKPQGLLMFTTFGPDTLKELRAAWSEADGYSHVSQFPDMHDVGDALLQASFADPVMDVDRITLTYQDVKGLMRDLKGLGAHNVTQSRQRGLTGKGRMKAMLSAYEGFRQAGRLPASYEVIYGYARAPLQVQKPSVVNVPLSQVGRI